MSTLPLSKHGLSPRRLAAGVERLTPHLTWLAPLLLVVVTAVTYLPANWATFALDDRAHILHGQRITSLLPLDRFLSRRGPVDFTLAVNYAIGGTNPMGYHLTNVVIHLLAGLALYGLMRRLLTLPQWRGRFDAHARWLALVIALIWCVHPLQTQAVTYAIQRAESMAGLFVLLAAYSLVRLHQDRRWWWALACIAATAVGVLSKESVAPAPIALFVLDGCLLAGGFGLVIRRRGWLYAVLLATLALPLMDGVAEFARPMASTTNVALEAQQAVESVAPPPVHVIPSLMQLGRFPSAGFGMPGMTWQQYFFTQPAVILFYLKQVVWPSWLSLEHPWQVMMTPWGGSRAIDLQVALGVMLALAVLSLWGVWRKSWLGVAGCWFFLFLGVSSSFIPINDLAVEHRMYLSLLPCVVVVVMATAMLTRRAMHTMDRALVVSIVTLMAVTVTAALATRAFVRNLDYRDEVTLWTSAASHPLTHGRVYLNLGSALYEAGHVERARQCFAEALLRSPGSPNALLNLGNIHYNRRELEPAELYYRKSLRIANASWIAMQFLARIHDLRGEHEQALAMLERAHRIHPQQANVLMDLGKTLFQLGRYDQARQTYEQVVEIQGPSAQLHVNLGIVDAAQGHDQAAYDHFTAATKLNPQMGVAWERLFHLHATRGRFVEALAALRQAIAVAPSMTLSQQLALLLTTCPDPQVRNLDEAAAIVEHGLALTQMRDPTWLETAAKVARAQGRLEAALDAELRALAIAQERGAPPEVIEQAQRDIQTLRQQILSPPAPGSTSGAASDATPAGVPADTSP